MADDRVPLRLKRVHEQLDLFLLVSGANMQQFLTRSNEPLQEFVVDRLKEALMLVDQFIVVALLLLNDRLSSIDPSFERC